MHFWYGGQTCAKVQKSVQKSVEILHIFCKNRRNFTFSGFCAKQAYSLKNHFFAKIVDKPLGKTRVPPPPPRWAIEENVFSRKNPVFRILVRATGPPCDRTTFDAWEKVSDWLRSTARGFFFPENFFFFREKKQCFIFFMSFCLKCPKEWT